MKGIKKFTFILAVFFILSDAFAFVQSVLGDIPLKKNENLFLEMPTNAKNDPEILISRSQYVISYNQKTRLLNWAAWKITTQNLGPVGRTNNFAADPDLKNYFPENTPVVFKNDYKGSCFDRGHQVPSGDRTDSKENNQTTFFMTNIIPQTAFLNRVIWRNLEEYTRDLVTKEGKIVYAFAGPIYDEDFGAIGPNKNIPIPSKNFKILIILDKEEDHSPEVLAFIMPNLLKSGKKPLEDKTELCSNPTGDKSIEDSFEFEKYQSNLSEVERLSGFIVKSP